MSDNDRENRKHDSRTFRWQAPEFNYQRKRGDWYLKVGILTFSIAVAAYVLNNFLFSILTLLSGFTLALFGAKQPEVIDMEISNKGVRIHDTLHPYSELEHFWISEEGREPKVLLHGRRMLHTDIIMPLGDADPEMVREELLKNLEEEEMAEPFVQRLIDRIGF